jgi:hypothetical protein
MSLAGDHAISVSTGKGLDSPRSRAAHAESSVVVSMRS